MYLQSSKFSIFSAFKVIAAKANLHSTTLLLYLVPTVAILAEGVTELAITNEQDDGTFTSNNWILGINSMSLATPNSPIIEIV